MLLEASQREQDKAVGSKTVAAIPAVGLVTATDDCPRAPPSSLPPLRNGLGLKEFLVENGLITDHISPPTYMANNGLTTDLNYQPMRL